MIPIPPGGTEALSKMFSEGAMKLFQAGMAKLTELASGKSAQQKEAEYWLSSMTNEIEKSMDINRWCFWTGIISQQDALQNYEFLWGTLVATAEKVSSITSAQAMRTISDRDYGGPFANIWRGVFRDEIVQAPADHMSNGYIVPEWQWDDSQMGMKLKYGNAASTISTPVPLARPADIPSLAGTGAAGVIGKALAGIPTWAKIGGGLLIGAKLLRFI
jgi:hypothetical protein